MPKKTPTFGDRMKAAHPRKRDDRAYEHRRRHDPGLYKSKKFRSSISWQRLQKSVLAKSPLCEDPWGDHERMSEDEAACEVHHVHALRDAWELRLKRENCAALCSHCHAKISAGERQGKDMTYLFKGR